MAGKKGRSGPPGNLAARHGYVSWQKRRCALSRRSHQKMTLAHEMNVVDNMVIRTDLDPYLSLKALSAYSGMSVKKLREALTDPVNSLPHYCVGGGKFLVQRSDFDQWIARFRQEGSDVDGLVAEIASEVEEDDNG